ncbi:MAG: PEP-CTERM sorting domain-containing protein, partial [bacterium]
AIENIDFRIGSYLGSSGGDAWITLHDGLSGSDVLTIVDGGSVGTALTNGPAVSGDGDLGPGTFLPWGLEITFRDLDGAALTSDSLPASIPALSEFEQARLALTFDDFATTVGGSISSITVVPEPSVSVLFGLGLARLASGARRRERQPACLDRP